MKKIFNHLVFLAVFCIFAPFLSAQNPANLNPSAAAANPSPANLAANLAPQNPANPNSANPAAIDFSLYKLESAPKSAESTPDSPQFLPLDSPLQSPQNPLRPQDSPPDSPKPQPTLLIIAGIQGDEPGGFNAASIFIKHYKITHGSVWVVPNLNQHSILRNHRGIFGDMNRKFALLSPNDPERRTIERIKALILSPNIARILHLHDGSGFYRESYISPLLNPHRWGNCSIIDQDTLFKDGDLSATIRSVVENINENLLSEVHRYRVKNTKGDTEQTKSLTFFATMNKKMAFANEASKTLPLRERVYYHLLAIEGMMGDMGIGFERDFEMRDLAGLLDYEDANLVVENAIELPLFDLRAELNFFPIPSAGSSAVFSRAAGDLGDSLDFLGAQDSRGDFVADSPKDSRLESRPKQPQDSPPVPIFPLDSQDSPDSPPKTPQNSQKDSPQFSSNTPIVWLFKDGKYFRIKNGNRTVGFLKPFFVEFDRSLKTAQMRVDGEVIEAKIPSIVRVREVFEVLPLGYRVNVIGFSGAGGGFESEAGAKITKNDLVPRFSVDRGARRFRVEFYKQESGAKDRFAGMIIVEFAP